MDGYMHFGALRNTPVRSYNLFLDHRSQIIVIDQRSYGSGSGSGGRVETRKRSLPL